MSASPCKGCEDRVPYPNCHMTCERYIEWNKRHLEKKEAIRKKELEERDITTYNIETSIKLKKKGLRSDKR